WTPGFGKSVLGGNNSNTNLAKKVSIQGLNLQENTDYYLSVRVTNGAGQVSPENNQVIPIRLDMVAPSAPLDQTPSSPINTGSNLFPLWGYQPNVVTEEPDMVLPPSGIVQASRSAGIEWSESSDNLSGIDKYRYVISENSNAQIAFDNEEVRTKSASRARELNLSGDPLSFTDSTYIHIWAEDHAKNLSEPLTIAIMPRDLTSPTSPWATIMNAGSALRLYIIRPSYDPESRIKGFQYAIGTTPYGSNIKAWPSASDLDDLDMGFFGRLALGFWRLDAEEDRNAITAPPIAPYYEIPTENLSEGQPLYITYRTVNGQDRRSGFSPTGPVTLDSSAPAKPSVTLSNVGNRVKIEVSNIKDDESGISNVEFKIVDSKNSYLSPTVPWRNFLNVSGTSQNTLSGTRQETYSNSFSNLRVGIRITNGNGMQSTYWFDGDQYMQATITKNATKSSGYNVNWSGK
ncbi:MAG: hypothetical protein AAFN93_05660, partial [Bacteroidota bacterium]